MCTKKRIQQVHAKQMLANDMNQTLEDPQYTHLGCPVQRERCTNVKQTLPARHENNPAVVYEQMFRPRLSTKVVSVYLWPMDAADGQIRNELAYKHQLSCGGRAGILCRQPLVTMHSTQGTPSCSICSHRNYFLMNWCHTFDGPEWSLVIQTRRPC